MKKTYHLVIYAPGNGDYGSDWKTVFYGPSDKATMISDAKYLEAKGETVKLLAGKSVGKLIYS